MDPSTAHDVHLILKTTFVQSVLKPLVIAVGLFFSIKGFVYLCLGIQFIWNVYIVPYFDKEYTLRKKFGDYVVITNATDALGAAFAKAFLAKGHSVILIIKEGDAAYKILKGDFEMCKASGGGEIIVITKDINKSDTEIYQSIKTQLKSTDFGIKSGILLNNAGFVGQHSGNFLQFTDSHVLSMVHNNVVDCLMVTKAVLEIMVQVKKGMIVNVAIPESFDFFSQSGFPLTMRKFTDEFNKIVRREFSELKALEVEAIHPGSICYGDGSKASKMSPTPEQFVESAIYKIGKAKTYSGYFYHSVVNFFEFFIPNFVYPIAYSINKMIREKKNSKEGEYQKIPSSDDP